MAGTFRDSWTGTWVSPLRYTVDRALPSVEFTPGRIALFYAMLGFAALYVSDVLLVRHVDDPAVLGQLQALKGGAEVVITAGLIFVLTRRSRRTLREQNDQLAAQREQLQVLHRVLRHNLRNDMNVVNGSAELMRREVDGAVARRCERIVEKANDVIGYVDTAGKINRVTADDANRVEVNLSRLVHSVIDDLDAGGNGETNVDGIDIDLDIHESTNAVVEVNPQFEEALTEVVTNALCHNDAAEPSVSVVVDGESAPRHMVDVRVEDNGPGIPEIERRALRENGSNTLRHASGLGLWFVYWTVRRSGGEFHIDDREPRGSVVTLRVPRAIRDIWEVPWTERDAR